MKIKILMAVQVVVLVALWSLAIVNNCFASWQDFNRNMAISRYSNDCKKRSNSDTVYVESSGIIIPVTVEEGRSKYIQTPEGGISVFNNPYSMTVIGPKGTQMIQKDR